MKRGTYTAWAAAGLAVGGGAATGCTYHTVEVKPIHATIDINLKIDRELDQFFDFEKELAAADAQANAAEPAPAEGDTEQEVRQ